MGTNFYWIERRHENQDAITQHIGKRSGAGRYCYDCGTTLNLGGTEFIHRMKSSNLNELFHLWSESCPSCGKSAEENADVTHLQGVAPAYSFTWTLLKHKREIERLAKTNTEQQIVVDEYGKRFTPGEFLELLQTCPIEFQSPGEFS